MKIFISITILLFTLPGCSNFEANHPVSNPAPLQVLADNPNQLKNEMTYGALVDLCVISPYRSSFYSPIKVRQDTEKRDLLVKKMQNTKITQKDLIGITTIKDLLMKNNIELLDFASANPYESINNIKYQSEVEKLFISTYKKSGEFNLSLMEFLLQYLYTESSVTVDSYTFPSHYCMLVQSDGLIFIRMPYLDAIDRINREKILLEKSPHD